MDTKMAAEQKLLKKKLLGYSNKLTVRSGETIEFKVSTARNDDYFAQLVRLINGDTHSPAANFNEVEIGAPINRRYPGRKQEIVQGSYVLAEDSTLLSTLDEFTLCINVMPTVLGLGKQAIIGCWNEHEALGWSLYLTKEGCLAFCASNHSGDISTAVLEQPLTTKQWHKISVRVSWVNQTIILNCMPLVSTAAQTMGIISSAIKATLCGNFVVNSAPLMIAASFMGRNHSGAVIPANCFDGRIEAPVIYKGILTNIELASVVAKDRPKSLCGSLVADWDFAEGIGSTLIKDLSPNRLHGKTYNLPLRAVKGTCWDGAVMDWRHAPSQYAAIHFHSDDLYDCGWLTDFSYQIPNDLPSGIYAVRLRQGNGQDISTIVDEEYIPFFVAAPKNKPTAKLAFLVPTYTYMAYGNFHFLDVFRQAAGTSKEEYYENHWFGPGAKSYGLSIEEHYDLGRSTYDFHSDGSPVHFSSWLRPLLNMRPKTILWTFCADLLITDWLESKDFDYDIITDDLLQEEGLGLLKNYQVVMSGNHPEYPTTEQLDAIQSYTEQGGRFMYMGGNGFYWRSAAHKTLPGVLEIRRGRTGSTAWKSEVGEDYHEFSGELGGIWRDIGRPPQQAFGVGFIAQGGAPSYYRIYPEARKSNAGFAFEGVDDDILGDFGIFGGAVGQEIDQSNPEYGTPDHTVVLARSENHDARMAYVVEETSCTLPVETYKTKTYAEIAFFETPMGGAVFSVGSMTWCGSLSHNDYSNNISKVTENVLLRLLDNRSFSIEATREMQNV